MVKNPPENCQHIVPYLSYRDAPAAIEFLCKAFGFSKGLVIPARRRDSSDTPNCTATARR